MISGVEKNTVEISGILVERSALRYTPAAVPVLECIIEHRSVQLENGIPRQVECRVMAVALGEVTRILQFVELGASLSLTGFLASKSRNSRQLRLHITKIDFCQGK